MKTYLKLITIILTIFLITSCKKENETPVPIEQPPVANAGNDASVQVGQKIELDGSGSNDPEGKSLTYAWVLKTKPETSASTLAKANEAKAEFTPDVAGQYVFELTVNNSKKTAKDEVKITATSLPYAGCVIKEGSISTPTVWTKIAPAGNVDYCVSQDLYITSSLTIEPGVVVEFAEGTRMYIDGDDAIIKAIGTENNKIIFTGKNKIKGYWKGIEMNSAENDANEFRYVQFSYAGSANHVSGFKAALSLRNNSFINIKNSVFENNTGYGMVIEHGKLLSFSQNTFTNNSIAALYIKTNQMGNIDSETIVVGGNGKDGIEVNGGTIDEDNEQVWPALKDGGKFFVMDNIHINSGVKIQEGAIFEFKFDKGIVVDGSRAYLNAIGSAVNKIIFSGIDKEKGSWKGIEFNSSQSFKNEFDHCEISYAGSVNHISGYKAGISSRNGSAFIISNSTIQQNRGYGIALLHGDFTVFENNKFLNNSEAAMLIPPLAVGKLDKESQFTGGNGKNGIEISAGTIDSNHEQVWPSFTDGSKYFVMENLFINSGVKIQEGAILEFYAEKGFTISGSGSYLLARGTAEKKIIFSGIVKTNGYWKGIEFNGTSSSKNELNHIEISYGGSSNHISGYKANISLRNGAEVSVLNSGIQNSSGWGIVHPYSQLITDDAQPNIFSGNISGNIKSN